MKTVSVNINVPEDIFAALNENEEGFKKEFTMSAAAWLYQNERLSLAKAASLAGVLRYDFENFLADNHIPISLLTAADILNDVKKI
jgi:predicted HTH domain antitoxin